MRVLPLGVLTLLLVAGLAFPVAAKETHEIQVSASEFTPRDLIILTGDTVRWIWLSGDHVIRNGEAPTSENAGQLFDFTLNGPNDAFEMVFSEAGTHPYFSAPQFDTMTGVITVQEATPVNPATWGWLKRAFEDGPASLRFPR